MKDIQRPIPTWKSGGICPFGRSGVGTEDAKAEMHMPIFEASHGRFVGPLFEPGDELVFEPDLIAKFMKIPYCILAQDPHGRALEQLGDPPATASTAQGFLRGFAGMEVYIGERMTARHHEIARQD